jgi:Domain of unknown function (DUF1707)
VAPVTLSLIGYSLSMMGEISPRGHDAVVPSADQLRASHEDRDQVIELLRVAAGDGRLTAEELDQRVEVAFSARTYGELTALTADLPAGGQALAPVVSAGPPVTPKDVVRIDCRSGNAQRDGRWIVPRRMELLVKSGNVRLDFTQAVISHRSVQIDADVRSGNLVIVTRPGIVVDTDDVEVRSGNIRVRAPWGPDVPVALMINMSGKVRSGNVVARPPRRSFWQWLTRQPAPYAITSGPTR